MGKQTHNTFLLYTIQLWGRCYCHVATIIYFRRHRADLIMFSLMTKRWATWDGNRCRWFDSLHLHQCEWRALPSSWLTTLAKCTLQPTSFAEVWNKCNHQTRWLPVRWEWKGCLPKIRINLWSPSCVYMYKNATSHGSPRCSLSSLWSPELRFLQQPPTPSTEWSPGNCPWRHEHETGIASNGRWKRFKTVPRTSNRRAFTDSLTFHWR